MNPDVNPFTLALADYHPRRRIRRPETIVDRAAVPAVDVHNHLGRWLSGDGSWMIHDVPALIALMDRRNVAHVVNLDGRWGDELVANIARYDRPYPDRFSTFAQLDFSLLADRGGVAATKALVAQLRQAANVGARGLKIWKDLGLVFRDASGDLILPADPRLQPIFDTAGELGLPILIHTADPVAFFDPIDRYNERLEELATNPDWWFGAPGLPSFDQLIDQLEAVVSSHPGTAFVGAHVGCAAEDLDRVSRMLRTYPNYNVDLGGRMAELGRQPRAARQLVIDHPGQVLFGTDQYPIVEAEYSRWFRFLETADECFSYAPDDEVPPMGRWDVSALDIPASYLPGLYAANARRLLGRA